MQDGILRPCPSSDNLSAGRAGGGGDRGGPVTPIECGMAEKTPRGYKLSLQDRVLCPSPLMDSSTEERAYGKNAHKEEDEDDQNQWKGHGRGGGAITPLSEIMEEAMGLLSRTPRVGHIQVDYVEYDTKDPFGKGSGRGNCNDLGREYGGYPCGGKSKLLTDEECDSELELAKEQKKKRTLY